jgi:Flp pilus assembly protein TadG
MRRWQSERGQELVEFALASSVFLFLVLATFLGGIQIWRYNTLSDLAQEGARWASVHGAGASTNVKALGTQANLTSFVQGRGPSSGITVSINPNVDPNTIADGTVITVTVSQPMVGWIGFGNWTGNVSASASEMMTR